MSINFKLYHLPSITSFDEGKAENKHQKEKMSFTTFHAWPDYIGVTD